MFSTFTSLGSLVLSTVFRYLSRDRYIGIVFESNEDTFFADAVKKYAGTDVRMNKGVLPCSFPPLYSYQYRSRLDELMLTAGATEPKKEVADVKAKGEFLERVSAYMPLQIARSKGYKKEVVVAALQGRRVLVRRAFGFGYTLVNASDVYFGLSRMRDGEVSVKRQLTTSGCAGYFDTKTATQLALLELIQRDAFMVFWLNSISPQHIAVDDASVHNADLASLLKKFSQYNLEYHFLDITSDIKVPTCACVVISDSPTGKRIGVGAATSFDVERALLSSATEALSVLSSVFEKEPYELKEPYTPFADMHVDRAARLALYTHDKHKDKYRFFIENKETISLEAFALSAHGLESPTKQWKYLRDIFTQRAKVRPEYDVYVYRFRNDLLRFFNYAAVRVMCKGLYSLYLQEAYADPNHPRLKEFVTNTGREKEAKLNIWPHPFP